MGALPVFTHSSVTSPPATYRSVTSPPASSHVIVPPVNTAHAPVFRTVHKSTHRSSQSDNNRVVLGRSITTHRCAYCGAVYRSRGELSAHEVRCAELVLLDSDEEEDSNLYNSHLLG